MRSSKSRSRNKNNRSNNTGNRSAINLVNRVFDSSGPEGKVRGTPQQIIDKYTQLARDAQLGNDRVAAENFQQHAEHYLRMLGEAQREIDARRDQEIAQQAHRDRQQQSHTQQSGHGGPQNTAQPGTGEQPDSPPQPPQATAPAGPGTVPQSNAEPEVRHSAVPKQEPISEARPEPAAVAKPEPQPRTRRPRTPRPEQPVRDDHAPGDVIDTGKDDGTSGLVETPESKPNKPRRPRSKPRPKTGDTAEGKSEAAE